MYSIKDLKLLEKERNLNNPKHKDHYKMIDPKSPKEFKKDKIIPKNIFENYPTNIKLNKPKKTKKKRN